MNWFPHKRKGCQRIRSFRLTLTTPELEQLDRLAASKNLTKSAFIRNLIAAWELHEARKS